MVQRAVMIEYESASVTSTALRSEIESALDGMGLRRVRGVWDALAQPSLVFPASPTIVVSDLHRLPDVGRLDRWSAGPGSTSFVFLVRTEADHRYLRDPEVSLRLVDRRFSLLDLSVDLNRRESAPAIERYFRALVARLDPDVVRFARYSPTDGLLWVEFGDGLMRGLEWKSLPFAARLGLEPVSASAAEHGQSVLMRGTDSREIDFDAEALRALVDEGGASRAAAAHASQRRAVGARLRALRGRAGISQHVLSARSGIPQESLSRLENGQRDPKLATLRKLAVGLDIELSEVLDALGCA